jgi:Ribbon-helix-helix protein, copG family
MTDLLIRDVPDDVVAAIDANARRLGLSRSEYLRRQLARDAVPLDETVTVEDLSRFAEVFADLGDPDVMARAWQ